jgi:hypothetical protein
MSFQGPISSLREDQIVTEGDVYAIDETVQHHGLGMFRVGELAVFRDGYFRYMSSIGGIGIGMNTGLSTSTGAESMPIGTIFSAGQGVRIIAEDENNITFGATGAGGNGYGADIGAGGTNADYNALGDPFAPIRHNRLTADPAGRIREERTSVNVDTLPYEAIYSSDINTEAGHHFQRKLTLWQRIKNYLREIFL